MTGRKPRARLWPALTLLLTAYGLAIGAGFLAPCDPVEQDRELPFAPPMRLHFVDDSGRFHLRPFVYRFTLVPGTFDQYTEDERTPFPLRLLAADAERGGRVRLLAVDRPARLHLLGTDGFGRDLLSRLLHGARLSLFAGLLAGVLAAATGLVLGALAGYYRGWVDELLMRGSELFLALPWLYLLLAARAFLPLSITPAQAFLLLVAVIGVLGWPRTALLVRAVVLSERERDYVVAARGFGATDGYLLRRHVLPQAFSVVATQLTLLVPQYILAEVTLSFLGLGVGEPTPSWGNLLAALQQYHVLVSYGWMFAPAVALFAVVLAFHLLADAVQKRRR